MSVIFDAHGVHVHSHGTGIDAVKLHITTLRLAVGPNVECRRLGPGNGQASCERRTSSSSEKIIYSYAVT